MHASAFQNRAARTAGDHAGTRAGRTQHDHARCPLTLNRVHNRATDQRDAEEVLTRFLHTFCDRGRNLFGLAVSDTDHAVAVTDDHQRGEAEPATTLDHLRDAVDRDDTLDVVAFLTAVATPTPTAVVTASATVAAATAGIAAIGAALRCCRRPSVRTTR